VPVLTWFTWGSVERALRRGEPLPASRVALPVAIGIATVAVLVLIGIVLE
jgi:putative membrane protein